MTRIFLAEDFDILRKSLKAFIDQEEHLEVVGDANNGQDAYEACQRDEVDLVLMDIEMPVMNGIQASQKIKTEFPHVKIIMLTMHNDFERIQPALELGVDGYLLKNTDPVEMFKAIRMVMDGGVYYTPSSRDVYNQGKHAHLNKERKLTATELSDREKEILTLIAEGKSTDEISDILIQMAAMHDICMIMCMTFFMFMMFVEIVLFIIGTRHLVLDGMGNIT